MRACVFLLCRCFLSWMWSTELDYLPDLLLHEQYDGCRMWSRICLPFRSTWDHPFFGGAIDAYSLCFFMCTIVCLFVFFIFSLGVVSLFSIYEFDCPFGIFRPSILCSYVPFNDIKLHNMIQSNISYFFVNKLHNLLHVLWTSLIHCIQII